MTFKVVGFGCFLGDSDFVSEPNIRLLRLIVLVGRSRLVATLPTGSSNINVQ